MTGRTPLGNLAHPFGSIRPYQRAWLSQDMLAGITLAALAIPEVMGYTKIAGTPVITGLYTILIPVVAFAILGSSRHLVVGGDSATAAIMYAGIAGLGIAGVEPGSDRWLAIASLSALICSVLLVVARVARLGLLANFISRTVLVGFLTGVGIQVALGQLGGMLGTPAPHVSAQRVSGTLIKAWDTLTQLGQASGATVAVSAAVLAVLVVFDRWVKAVPGGLVAVVGAIVVSWAADLQSHGVSTLGAVPSGLPHIGLPPGVGWNTAESLFATAGSMFLVILAQSAATSRAYAVKYRERFSEDDDLLGLSAANLAAGLSGTFVVNGSPTKTEMVDEAHGRTQVAQLTMAAVVAVVLLFLTRPLQYLPNAVLSSVVFLIGIKLIDIRTMREIWRLRRDEFVVAAVTTVTVVILGVEQGIVLAIVLSLVLHVRRHYAPHDVWSEPEPGLVVYRFGVGLFYANTERLQDEIIALVDVPHPPAWLVLQADAMDDVDYTGGKALLDLQDQLQSRGIVLAVAQATDHLAHELDRFGITAPRFATVAAARDAFERRTPGS
ncbi:MAG TPA: SulP family inorganic anion transporter [Gaiellales bacterium]|jgi:SulP family sulfate permease|nr:SulP family inorganic anion transporter [Gaiellales bacterium]